LKNSSRSQRASPNRRQGLSPSAKGKQLLPLDIWPPEGRTLGAILRELTSPAEWSQLTKHTGELLPPHLNASGKWVIIPANPPDNQATTHPIVDIWNSGQLIAKGRRGDLLAAPETIPSPSIGYDIWVADFTRSIIRDPTYPDKKIYDLRFFPRNAETKSENATKTPTITWVTDEVKRMKAAGELKGSIRITELARNLESRMKTAAQVDESLKKVGWRYIKNKLRDWNLWPIESIN
jgi:hypothetical protein